MTSAVTAPASAARTATRSSEAPPRPPDPTLREAAAALALISAANADLAGLAARIETLGSALAVLVSERLAAAPQTSFFSDPEAELDQELGVLQRQIAEWRTQGLQLLTVLDTRYPGNLREIPERPALLFMAGRLKPRDDRGIVVVGSPEADPAQLRAAGELAAGLAAQGHTVISGLAAGVDTTAHLAALKRGGRTIAVIGTGLSRCYPRANVILQRRIAAECAVVSQFVPDTAPSGETFAARNPVMSGMGLATIVVAASPTGATRAHACQAVAQSRPLIMFESLLRHKWARELAGLPAVTVVATPDEALQTIAALSPVPSAT